MSKVHREQIRKHWAKFICEVQPGTLTSLLFASEVLTVEEKETIDIQPTNSAKNDKILEFVFKKADWAYQQFIKDLRETEQQHIADLLETSGLYSNYFQ